ncbi:chymotrypsin inhibitor Ani s 6-like [Ostrinia furnacalis]|uniref:chymotrypsin inhibitor Ani s 6-like n=1 Tax=Ostrinia furnacalis TaxID=93504 RepID=UPI00103CE78A|nr:chymotrypsin inhibitor Ani s 6-like [Ostrinia furnacalis]
MKTSIVFTLLALIGVGAIMVAGDDVPCPDGDPNAVYVECPSNCQPTCQKKIPDEICNFACLPRQCVCKPGYILEKKDGKCIPENNC